MRKRAEIAMATAQAVAGGQLGKLRGVLGFDGFVDEIIDVVDIRHAHDRYERLTTIAEFAKRIGKASGTSSNFELVTRQRKLGGNGPIMANALAMLGMGVDYIGTVGDSVGEGIDPVFAAFMERAKLLSMGPAAHTSALEFLDGKLMLGNLASLSAVTWEALVQRIGIGPLRGMLEQADLLGLVNWTMLPHLTEIWRAVSAEIRPQSPRGKQRVFIDLADPAKRPVADLKAAMQVLSEMNRNIPVTLGLNWSEALQVAEAFDLGQVDNPQARLRDMAVQIRARLELATVVIHPRHGAAAATESGGVVQQAEFAGPFVKTPAISTGAGDHFNAGFAAGELLGLPLDECLCLGTAVSGYYVRHAASPTADQLAAFLEMLPEAEG